MMMKKVVVVGAGNVGSHIVSASMLMGISADFFLIDLQEDFESAQVLDLRDSVLFSGSGGVFGANFGDSALSDAHIWVIASGVSQKPGESRLDLLQKNAALLADLREKIGPLSPSAIILLVTNPVDLLTHIAAQIFGLPWGQVFGTGTALDSARLRWHLGEKYGLHPRSVHGWVLGEHGDSQFVAWSGVHISGTPLCIAEEEKKNMEKHVREEAFSIISGKGSTFFGIGAVTADILRRLLTDEKSVLPVSVPLRGEFGVADLSLSLPVVLGEKGVLSVVLPALSEEEQGKFFASAEKMKFLLAESDMQRFSSLPNGSRS